MIPREELAAALDSLDSFDREVLELSLRRRVPDEALAHVYGLEPGEVGRRRAGAIERLSAALDVQRGEDLGQMLQALLEPETWAAVASPPAPDPDAEPAEVVEAEPPLPDPEPESEPEPEAEPEPAPPTPVADEPAHPVLEMLEQPRESAAEPDRPRKGRRFTAAIAAAATVLLPAGGIVAAAALDDDSGGDGGSRASDTQSFVPQGQDPVGQPFPSDPATVSGYPVARLRQGTVLYETPGGRRKLRVPVKTEWGTSRVLGVVRQSGDWAAVQVPELPNREVAWARAGDVTLETVAWSLRADVSRRALTVEKAGRVVRRMKIAVGNPANPTPTGRFSVTDKLRVSDPASPYGCCVLALSGHQVKLPKGWPGGDRLAVHATRDSASIGKPVSLGCMRAATAQARWLIQNIPIGAPIFIER